MAESERNLRIAAEILVGVQRRRAERAEAEVREWRKASRETAAELHRMADLLRVAGEER